MLCEAMAMRTGDQDTDDERWTAVLQRDAEADGAFVYAVITTGIYCRPSCPSRRPKRENARFFDLPREAAAAGFRPCKRCRPDEMSARQRQALAVEAACRRLEAEGAAPTLADLAADAGLSPFHFQRLFKAHTGLTPRQYHAAERGARTATALAGATSVTDAAFASGFASLSAFYDAVASRHGLAPATLSARGEGEVIVTAGTRCTLGWLTAAFSRRGVAAVRLTDTADSGMREVEAQFGRALLVPGGADFDALVDRVAAAVEEPKLAEELPLDVRGTAFEERVWAQLRAIPVGSTATYGEVAAAIGAPRAHRAVARACAANKIAVLIPCHRVVRADGSLAGYRWGPERKAALLAAEAVHG